MDLHPRRRENIIPFTRTKIHGLQRDGGQGIFLALLGTATGILNCPKTKNIGISRFVVPSPNKYVEPMCLFWKGVEILAVSAVCFSCGESDE